MEQLTCFVIIREFVHVVPTAVLWSFKMVCIHKKNKWHAYRLLVACSTSFFPRFGVPSADICCLKNHLLSWLDEYSSKPNRFSWA